MLRYLAQIDLEKALSKWATRLQPHIVTVLIAFVINLLIFGQRLFGGGLATDDLARFYFPGGEQASWLGRWFGGLLSQTAFTGPLQILPYLNGLLSILCITLAGYFSSVILSVQKRFPAVLITLLCSATPFMVHNLYFNTNTSVFVGLVMGVGGVLLAYQSRWSLKVLGIVLLMCSIGTYQTIIQITLTLILFRTILNLTDVADNKAVFTVLLGGAYMVAFVILAFIGSTIANWIVTILANATTRGGYANSLEVTSIMTYVDRLVGCYSIQTGLRFFAEPYSMGIKLFALIGIGTLFLSQRLFDLKNLISLRGLYFVVFVLSLPVVISLPEIVGREVPTRAHLTIGWMTACLFVVTYSHRVWSKNIGLIVSVYLLLFGTLYINVFLYAGQRQTDMDIIRANQIVSAIRQHSEYPGEEQPLKLKIVGVKELRVIGWRLWEQSAFATNWSNTKVFEHFSDLNFVELSEAEYSEIRQSIVDTSGSIHSYPDPSSIIVRDDVVILVLDPDELVEPELP